MPADGARERRIMPAGVRIAFVWFVHIAGRPASDAFLRRAAYEMHVPAPAVSSSRCLTRKVNGSPANTVTVDRPSAGLFVRTSPLHSKRACAFSRRPPFSADARNSLPGRDRDAGWRKGRISEIPRSGQFRCAATVTFRLRRRPFLQVRSPCQALLLIGIWVVEHKQNQLGAQADIDQ